MNVIYRLKRVSGSPVNPGEIYFSYSDTRIAHTDLNGKEVVYPEGIFEIIVRDINNFELVLIKSQVKTYTNYKLLSTNYAGSLPSIGTEIFVEFNPLTDFDYFQGNTTNYKEHGFCWCPRPYGSEVRAMSAFDYHGNKREFEIGDICRITPTKGAPFNITLFDYEEDTYSGAPRIKLTYNNQGWNDEFSNILPFKIEKVLDGGGGESVNLLRVGDTPISNAFVGDAPVSRIYAGDTLVFGAGEA